MTNKEETLNELRLILREALHREQLPPEVIEFAREFQALDAEGQQCIRDALAEAKQLATA
jgi:hypothetical protein